VLTLPSCFSVKGVIHIDYMNTFVVSSRDIQRNYSDVISRVRDTKQAALLISQNEPQAVIVPLEEYKQLEQLQRKRAIERLLALAKEIAEKYKDAPIPSDLAINHDKYFAEAAEADLERIRKQYDHNR
jgi:prevent-host-death family protein